MAQGEHDVTTRLAPPVFAPRRCNLCRGLFAPRSGRQQLCQDCQTLSLKEYQQRRQRIWRTRPYPCKGEGCVVLFLRQSPNEQYHHVSCMPVPALRPRPPRKAGRWQTFLVNGMTTAEFAFQVLMERQGVEVIRLNGHTRLFPLPGTTYTPDFSDPTGTIFYEVIATRQAYSANQDKYAMFRATYPNLTLTIVKPDGSPVEERRE